MLAHNLQLLQNLYVKYQNCKDRLIYLYNRKNNNKYLE
jgi:hypothetical protein